MSVPMHPQRRLRIMGKHGDTRGFMLQVFDHDTGESISNIFHIDISCDVNDGNIARVTYYEADKQSGHVLLDKERDEPIEHTDVIKDVELDVTAKLFNSWREKDI